jgi:uncharacterized membrane protein
MNRNTLIRSAIAGLLASGVASLPAIAADKVEMEKCYGIAKAGKNDCQTSSSSCAGSSKTDAQKDAWIYVPKGTCDKIVGAGTKPKS